MEQGADIARRRDLTPERRVLAEFIGFKVEPRWEIDALRQRLADMDRAALDGALVSLVVGGLLRHEGKTVRLAPSVVLLDAMGLLAKDYTYADAAERTLARRALHEHTGDETERARLIDRGLSAGLPLDEIRDLTDAALARA